MRLRGGIVSVQVGATFRSGTELWTEELCLVATEIRHAVPLESQGLHGFPEDKQGIRGKENQTPSKALEGINMGWSLNSFLHCSLFFSLLQSDIFLYITIILSSFVLLSFSWSEIERSGIITGKFKAGVGSCHENSVYIDTLVHPRCLYSIAWHFKGMSITDLNGWLLLRFGYV